MAGVIRAANDLSAETKGVTEKAPSIFYKFKSADKNGGVIGTSGKSEFLDDSQKKIDISEIPGNSFGIENAPLWQ